MNQKIKGLSREMVYSFLIGLILGGLIIGWLDANAKKPIFSKAGFCQVQYHEVSFGTSSAVGTGADVGESGSAGSNMAPFVVCEGDSYEGLVQPEQAPQN